LAEYQNMENSMMNLMQCSRVSEEVIKGKPMMNSKYSNKFNRTGMAALKGGIQIQPDDRQFRS